MVFHLQDAKRIYKQVALVLLLVATLLAVAIPVRADSSITFSDGTLRSQWIPNIDATTSPWGNRCKTVWQSFGWISANNVCDGSDNVVEIQYTLGGTAAISRVYMEWRETTDLTFIAHNDSVRIGLKHNGEWQLYGPFASTGFFITAGALTTQFDANFNNPQFFSAETIAIQLRRNGTANNIICNSGLANCSPLIVKTTLEYNTSVVTLTPQPTAIVTTTPFPTGLATFTPRPFVTSTPPPLTPQGTRIIPQITLMATLDTCNRSNLAQPCATLGVFPTMALATLYLPSPTLIAQLPTNTPVAITNTPTITSTPNPAASVTPPGTPIQQIIQYPPIDLASLLGFAEITRDTIATFIPLQDQTVSINGTPTGLNAIFARLGGLVAQPIKAVRTIQNTDFNVAGEFLNFLLLALLLVVLTEVIAFVMPLVITLVQFIMEAIRTIKPL